MAGAGKEADVPRFAAVELQFGGVAERAGELTLEYVVRWSDGRLTLERVTLPYGAGQSGGGLAEALAGRAGLSTVAHLPGSGGRVRVTAGSDANIESARVLRNGEPEGLVEREQNQDGITMIAAQVTTPEPLAVAVGVGIYGSSRLNEGWIDIEFETPGMLARPPYTLDGRLGTSGEVYARLLLDATTADGLNATLSGNTVRVLLASGSRVVAAAHDFARAGVPWNTAVAVLRNNTGMSSKYYVEVWALTLL